MSCSMFVFVSMLHSLRVTSEASFFSKITYSQLDDRVGLPFSPPSRSLTTTKSNVSCQGTHNAGGRWGKNLCRYLHKPPLYASHSRVWSPRTTIWWTEQPWASHQCFYFLIQPKFWVSNLVLEVDWCMPPLFLAFLAMKEVGLSTFCFVLVISGT